MIMKNLTFGKYKNQAINEIFKKDKNYIEWLCKQSWFIERHKPLYNQCISEIENYNPTCYEDKFLVYTDGACPNNGSPNAISSIGIHFSDKNKVKLQDISEKLNVRNPSNNVAELTAILRCCQIIKENNIEIPIHLYTDSSYCKDILNEWYEKWLTNDLLHNKKNLELIEETYSIFKSIDNMFIHHVKGHTRKTDEHSYGNYVADQLARNAFKNIKV